MSANEISNVVLLFPNIEWPASDTDTQLFRSVAQLRPNISYAENINGNIQTLSTHNTPAGGLIQGFLYVPDLAVTDPCYNISKQYIPSNVTRQANLPPTDFTLIALAPWINAECTLSYLSAARTDPMRAFIFYLPDNTTAAPPLTNSPDWALQDGGQWRSANPYPVFAVPGAAGARMMHELSLYSGNLTNVPFGNQIAELPDIDVRDYVRVFSQISVPTSRTPGVWLFIIIIIAVLVIMLALTSATMHLLQRHRRKALHRRVISGEVDLEALGIKRLTVPDEIINKMPLFTYNCVHEKVMEMTVVESTLDPRTATIEQTGTTSEQDVIAPETLPGHDGFDKEIATSDHVRSTSRDITSSNTDSIFAHKFLPHSQPTCPICLDDFESGTTIIRELPCGHIFHPECIDTFLSENSSLCPMCKESVLPVGYCATKITNNMVRRERNMRRIRARVTMSDPRADVERGNGIKRLQDWGHLIGRSLRSSPAYGPQASSPISLQTQDRIMSNAAAPGPRESVLGNQVLQPMTPGLSRQEIAQRRIRELAADAAAPLEDPEVVNPRRRSKWRRRLAKAFPGFS